MKYIDANLYIAQRESNFPTLSVRPIRLCGGCNEAATVVVQGRYPRCQPCANKTINYWNEMRAAKNAAQEPNQP